MSNNLIKVVCLLATVVILYGYFYEKNNIVVETVTIGKEVSAPGLNHIKMVQFSDLHFQNVWS